MPRSKPRVLVLHNVPRHDDSGSWLESDAGVLDEVQAVSLALERLGYRHRVAGAALLSDLPAILADADEEIVFNLVEGFQLNPAQMTFVPAFAGAYGKSHTGSDTPCLALTLDKWRTRGVLQAVGLPCPPGFLVPLDKKPRRPSFDGPYIVKPVACDASEGVDDASVVADAGRALAKAVRRVHEEFAQAALVERFIDGRELNIAVLERAGELQVLPVAEIVFTDYGDARPRIVGYGAKWLEGTFEYDNTNRVVPARLPAETASRAQRTALAAWRAVGCNDYARVDFRLAPDGALYVLEVNPNPDITPGVGFSAALDAAGVPYEEFVDTAVANAFARLARSQVPARPCTTVMARAAGPSDARPEAPDDRPTDAPGAGSCGPCANASDRPSGAAPRGRGVSATAGRSADDSSQGPPLIRRTQVSDRAEILRMLRDTGFFRDDEIATALEVLDEALRDGPSGHYQSYTVECSGSPAGWICFGPTPCTVATWDIYWIVVDPRVQARGLGKALMAHAEERIRASGGLLAVVETSGRESYLATQRFYLKVGYSEAARIEDFYAPGDAKIIYTRRLA